MSDELLIPDPTPIASDWPEFIALCEEAANA